MIQLQIKAKDTGPTTFNLALMSRKIVFMGTPEFAVASLEALMKAGFNIAAVVTAPDRPAGRGMKLQQSAVKKFAMEHGLRVLQPEKLKSPGFIEELSSIQADLQVVVAFRMLPEIVWSMPSLGTINLHASLLPQYRGAAPINWVLINGEKETGATTFKLKHEIDTGNILMQESFPIGEDETAGELHDRMKLIGADLLTKTVQGILDGTLTETPQKVTDPNTLRHAPKINTDTCRIDWNKTTAEVHNLIRGLSPYPGAFTIFNEKILKVYRSEKELTKPTIPPGTHETDGKSFLRFATSDGYIRVLEIQPEGKKRMMIADFLRGFRQ